MRELSQSDVQDVSGGSDPEKRLPTVYVTAKRRTMSTWEIRNFLDIQEMFTGQAGLHEAQGTSTFTFNPDDCWGEGCAENPVPIQPSEENGEQILIEEGVTDLLDELSGGAYTSGQEAADLINGILGLDGDKYAFREEILATYEFLYGDLPDEIGEAFVNAEPN
ncbi:MAG: hypothetical protein AAF829_11235 [Pseudomonadota bacterium]